MLLLETISIHRRLLDSISTRSPSPNPSLLRSTIMLFAHVFPTLRFERFIDSESLTAFFSSQKKYCTFNLCQC
jgi:hypothetical protein